jgi:hypothetical protein
MRLCTILMLGLALPSSAWASTDFGCDSKDGKLRISHMYYHGDSSPDLPATNFEVAFERAGLGKTKVRKHKYSDGVLVLELASGSKVLFSVSAKEAPEKAEKYLGDPYLIEAGFVVVGGRKIDLKGTVIYCAIG